MKKTWLISMLLFIAIGSNAQENLLKDNSDFETGNKNGWVSYGDDNQRLSVSKDAAFSGNFGLKLILGDAKTILYSNPNDKGKFKVEIGKRYCFEFMIKVISKGSGIQLNIYPSSRGALEGDIREHTNLSKIKLDEWNKIRFEFMGQDVPDAKFNLIVNKGEYFFDDFKLYELK